MADETETSTEQAPAPRAKARRRPARHLWRALAAMVFAIVSIAILISVSLPGRSLRAPGWVAERVAERLNAAVDGPRMTIGRVFFTFDWSGLGAVRLANVGVFDARGAEVARLNDVRLHLSVPELLRGRFEPEVVRLAGAQITVRRLADGQFDLSLGGSQSTTGTLASVLDAVDAAFAVAPLDAVERVEAVDLTIGYQDARSGRIWQITQGAIQAQNLPDGVDLGVNFNVFNGTETLAQTSVSIRTDAASSRATIGTTFRDAAAADIALQSPALSFLGVLDSTISGAVRAELADDGSLAGLTATLEVDKGVLSPVETIRPVAFEAGKVYLDYDPQRQRIRFPDLSLRSQLFTMRASGYAYLRDFEGQWPRSLVAQFSLADVIARPDALFAEPMSYESGAADFRLRLSPFAVDFGQISLVHGTERVQARGSVRADEGGWTTASEVKFTGLVRDRFLALWPDGLAEKSRDWVARNVTAARFPMVSVNTRSSPGAPLRYALDLGFEGATVRYVPNLPPVTDAAGYATVDGQSFTAVFEAGAVRAPMGGAIDVAGTSFRIADIKQKPAQGQLALTGDSTATATLALIAEPPFSVLRNAAFGPDVAEGRVHYTAKVSFPLLARLTVDDVTYSVEGQLHDIRSDKLVPGRVFTAETLDLVADNDRTEIFGSGRVGLVEADAIWQKFNDGTGGGGSIAGQVRLGPEFLEEFRIGLPQGSVRGGSPGRFRLVFPASSPPEFDLTSDVVDLQLAIPEVGWSKPAGVAGSLNVTGKLGERPQVDFLELQAPGLDARGGTVTITEDGGLGTARFERVRIGDWFNAPVAIRGRGASAPPAISVNGGTVDIRKTSMAEGGRSASSSIPIALTLDRVVVSEGITLTAFSGDLRSAGGLSGTFTAQVNGGTPIEGQLAPDTNGTAVRIASRNAGAALRDAGVIDNANGGTMDLTLRPIRDGGAYRGEMAITETRVIKAPALTELLNALSIVGLLDQLSGGGIFFSNVDASFRLSPDRFELIRSSATGPSMGISLDGTYDLNTRTLDMQGVISPVYFLNAIGQLVSPRRGEGLFGFAFRLGGSASQPQVRVNPLSILAPGMFRDIFRQQPNANRTTPEAGQ